MQVIFGIVTVMVLMALGMVGGYVSGSVFDYFMGTHATPLFTLAGLIGMGVSASSDKPMSEQFGESLVLYIVWPFVALIGAFVASLLFPQTTQAFIDMLGYNGSIYGLAFWGSVTYGITKAVIGFIVALIAEMVR